MQCFALDFLIDKTTQRFGKDKLLNAIKTVSSEGQICLNKQLNCSEIIFICVNHLYCPFFSFHFSLLCLPVLFSLRLTMLLLRHETRNWSHQGPFSTFQLGHTSPAKISQWIAFVSDCGCLLDSSPLKGERSSYMPVIQFLSDVLWQCVLAWSDALIITIATNTSLLANWQCEQSVLKIGFENQIGFVCSVNKALTHTDVLLILMKLLIEPCQFYERMLMCL